MHAALQRKTSYTSRFAQQKHGLRAANSYAPQTSAVSAVASASAPASENVGQKSSSSSSSSNSNSNSNNSGRSGDLPSRGYKRLEHDLPRTARAQHLFGPPQALPEARAIIAPKHPVVRAATASTRGWTHIFVELAPPKAVPPKPGVRRRSTGTAPYGKRRMIEVDLAVGLDDDPAGVGSLVHLRGVITKVLRLLKIYFLGVRRRGEETLLTSIRDINSHDLIIVYGIRRTDEVLNWKAGEDRPKGMFRSTSRRVEHGGPATTKIRRRRRRQQGIKPPASSMVPVEATKQASGLTKKKLRKSLRILQGKESYYSRPGRRYRTTMSQAPPLVPPPPPDSLALLENALPLNGAEQYEPYEEDEDEDEGEEDEEEEDEDEEKEGEAESKLYAIESRSEAGAPDDSYEARLITFLNEKDPERTSEVPILLDQYEGLEEELITLLVSEYGPTEREVETEATLALQMMPEKDAPETSESDESDDLDTVAGSHNQELQLESPANSSGRGSNPPTLRATVSTSSISLDQHRRELMQLSTEMNPPENASPWTSMKRSLKSADDPSRRNEYKSAEFTSLADLEQLATEMEERVAVPSPTRRSGKLALEEAADC